MRLDGWHRYDGIWKTNRSKRCPHPGCEERERPPYAPCACPTMIALPPGQHMHVDCPRHGKVIIRGPDVRCSLTAHATAP